MRNLKLIDAVIALHDISITVREETEDTELAHTIRLCADKLHDYSIDEGRASEEASEIIKKAKE
jgi:hypothetical protein